MAKRITLTFEGKRYKIIVPDEVMTLPDAQRSAYLEDFLLAQSASKGGDVGSGLSEAWGQMTKPLTRVPEIYKQEVAEGGETLSRGLDQLTGGKPFSGLGNLAMGGLQALWAGPESVTRALAGEPTGGAVQSAAGALGASDETAQQIGQLAEDTTTIGSQVFTPGAWAKGAQAAGAELTGLAKTLAGGSKQLPRAAPIPQATGMLDEPVVAVRRAAEEVPVDETSKGLVERMSLATANDIVTDPGLMQRIERARQLYPDDDNRLFKEVGAALRNDLLDGDLPIESLPRILDDLGMGSRSDVAKIFEVTGSESGRMLNMLSQLQRRLSQNKDLPENLRRELAGNAEKLAKGTPESFSKGMDLWRKAENFRRGLLVSQLGTAVRNAISAVGRLGLATIDDVIQAGMGGGRGKGSFKDMWNSLSSDFNALPIVRGGTGYKQMLDDVLEANPIAETKLLSRPINEVQSLGKMSRMVNAMNIFQEKAFRRMAFQAKLEKDLRGYGLTMKDLSGGKLIGKSGKPVDIPSKLLDDAIEHALDMTFASSGGAAAKATVQAFEKLPFLYAINPFPRFQFANVLPFMMEHSPLGFAKAFSPKTIAKLTQGDSKEFTRAASRAMLGTTMFASANELRNGPHAGEKWYEVNVGGKTYDARPFAPFSLYLLAAEFIKPNNNLTGKDYIEAATGINRISGTGLMFVDALRYKGPTTGEKIKEMLAEFFGAGYVAAPTLPIKQIKDLSTIVGGDETIRDVKQDTAAGRLVAPAMRNIPGLSEQLRPARSPLKAGTLKQSEGFFGLPGDASTQLFGLRGKNKTIVEKEVDKLGIDFSTYMPRTGIAEANNYLAGKVGKEASVYIPELMKSRIPVSSLFPFFKKRADYGFNANVPYNKLSKAGKKIALREIFKLLKKRARNEMKRRQPELAQRVAIEGIPQVEEEWYMEQLQ
jgi:hypothetical protein